jgi:hypothetical protein
VHSFQKALVAIWNPMLTYWKQEFKDADRNSTCQLHSIDAPLLMDIYLATIVALFWVLVSSCTIFQFIHCTSDTADNAISFSGRRTYIPMSSILRGIL